jgi:hypothetical protein
MSNSLRTTLAVAQLHLHSIAGRANWVSAKHRQMLSKCRDAPGVPKFMQLRLTNRVCAADRQLQVRGQQQPDHGSSLSTQHACRKQAGTVDVEQHARAVCHAWRTQHACR